MRTLPLRLSLLTDLRSVDRPPSKPLNAVIWSDDLTT